MTGYVYAIAAGERVKIGFSTVPRARLLSLRTGSAEHYTLLGYIAATQAQEAELHVLLAPQRIRGEWFRREGPVNLFIDMLPKLPKPTARPLIKHGNAQMTNLTALRKAKGLSQVRLAEACGLPQPSIARFETGARDPKMWQVKRIASALGVSAAELVGGVA